MIQPLKSVCEIIMGQAPAGDTYNDNRIGLPLIAGAGDFGALNPKPTRYTTAAAKISRVGDIIICVRATIGDLNWSDRVYCLGRGVAALRVNTQKADRNYIWRVIEYGADRLSSLGRGATFKQISKPDIADFKIPLPPLAEQKRIAAILDQADDLRRKRQRAFDRLNQLGQAIFMEMFVEGERDEWPTISVQELANETAGGIRTGPFGSQLLHSEFVEEGVAVLGIDNAVSNQFQWGQRRYITPEKYNSLKRYRVYPGDVIITIMGTCGRCAIVPPETPLAINTKHLCCITLQKNICKPEYLHSYFLNHPTALEYLRSKSKGAIMDGLNMGIIKAMPIRLPPLWIQQEYADKLTLIENQRSMGAKTSLMATELFTSLQHRAFTGELTASSLKEAAV